jgi:hypothetical protein
MFTQAAIIGALIGFAVMVLATVIVTLAYVRKAQVERMQGPRRVLYFLLEIRYATTATLFNPGRAADQYIKHFIERLRQRHLRVSEEQVPQAVRIAIEGFFGTLASDVQRELRERLVVPLESALLDMATTDPLAAYHLRSKERVERLVGHGRKPPEVTVPTGTTRHDIKETSAKIALDWLSLETTDHTLNELEGLLSEDILRVAAACGSEELRRVQQVLAQVPERRYRFDEINDYLDAILTKVIDRLHITSLASA